MAQTRDLYLALRNMVIQNVDTTIYLPQYITRTYQAVDGDNFIVFELQPSTRTSLKGVKQLNVVDHSVTYISLMETMAQIDVYTTDTDSTIAYDTALNLQQFLVEEATEYLEATYGNNDITIGSVENIVNNTDILDNPVYTARYTVRFVFLSHLINTNANVPYYDSIQPNIIGVK